MDRNWIELLSLFDRYEVRYLIVGGYAVMFHAQPRGTKDLDLYVDSSRSNAEAVYAALVAFGAPMAGMKVEDFTGASSVYQIGQPPLRIDLISDLDGIDFSSAWESRVEAFEEGVPVRYIGAEALVANKLATARLQDLADAEAIQASRAANASKKRDGAA